VAVDGLGSRFMFTGWFSAGRFVSVELGDSVLAVVVADLAELFENLGLIDFCSFLVALGNALEVFAFRFRTHKTPYGLGKV